VAENKLGGLAGGTRARDVYSFFECQLSTKPFTIHTGDKLMRGEHWKIKMSLPGSLNELRYLAEF